MTTLDDIKKPVGIIKALLGREISSGNHRAFLAHTVKVTSGKVAMLTYSLLFLSPMISTL